MRVVCKRGGVQRTSGKGFGVREKAFAVVARSYVKTLREMGRLERALEPLKYALKMYSATVSRKR